MAPVERLIPAAQIAAIAAFVHLDRVVVLQSLFHRPVFLAPLLGVIADSLATAPMSHDGIPFTFLGLAVPVAFVAEFASLLVPPTGTDLPSDESAWTATIMLSVVLAGSRAHDLLPFLILVSLPSLWIFRNMDVWIRNANGRLARYAEAQLRAGFHIPFKRLVFATSIGQTVLYAVAFLGLGLLAFGFALLLRDAAPFHRRATTLAVGLACLGYPLWLARKGGVLVWVGRPFERAVAATVGLILGLLGWLW